MTENTADSPAPTSSFAGLGLLPQVEQAVASAGYSEPSPIQAEMIPHLMAERDVVAQSRTGSGKTAAFALPVLSRLLPDIGAPQALVLAPTRELARQVADSFRRYGRGMEGLSVTPIYGGQEYRSQLRGLRDGTHIVVGTPGRLIDHVKKGTLDLSALRMLVLDEADEMLNMGFADDVEFLLEKTPPTRQTALFSATMPDRIRGMADKYLNDPVRVTLSDNTLTAESIRQRAVFVPPVRKPDALRRFLELEDTDGVIVFTKTREATNVVAETLVKSGYRAVALNGDMPQATRERTIGQLKSGRLDVLVATDVAARGLDVPRVSHVINYDMPQDSESYVHRIGRTGRAGKQGEAILFLTNGQRHRLRVTERVTGQPIEVAEVPTAEQINEARVRRLREQIVAAASSESKELAIFRTIIEEVATENDIAPLDIAAAVALASRNGEPLLMEDPPDRRRNRTDRTDRTERRDGEGDRASGGDPGDRDDRPRREIRPPESGMERFHLKVGKINGIRPGQIVRTIAEIAGLDGREIGQIHIFPRHTTVDLPQGMPRDIFELLRTTKIAGRELRIDRDRGPGQRGPRPRKHGPGSQGKDSRPPGPRRRKLDRLKNERIRKRHGKGGPPSGGKKDS